MIGTKRRQRLPRTDGLDHFRGSSRKDGQELPAMVMNRIAWYQAAGRRNRKRYALTEITAVLAAAAVPVTTTARLDGTVIAALGAIVLVATGVRTTFQIHENWIEDNRMRYDIEREAALFLVDAPPYQGPDAARDLVVRIELFAHGSGHRWLARRTRIREQEETAGVQPPALGQ
ncbi:DUF4231 domain-containing protein [Amycolatopsis keratiniphila]|uniref:DUF4231 domain-containing protein n=1 Tax=Amycolatopsis keratiniphila TaxID=129921 RepID=UPI0011774A5D|nr:DUF4231 domain-containing protein [Amycolatopsis keratiniphila]